MQTEASSQALAWWSCLSRGRLCSQFTWAKESSERGL
jgi:hypothetical protein